MKILQSVKGIILINLALSIPNIILYASIFIVPLLFIGNIILAILNFKKQEKELAITHLICAFIVPLIGPSICLGSLVLMAVN